MVVVPFSNAPEQPHDGPNGTFIQVLCWHLTNGTRPGRHRPVKPWDDLSFAMACLTNVEVVQGWRTGARVVSVEDLTTIEQVLFRDDATKGIWRRQLNDAYFRAHQTLVTGSKHAVPSEHVKADDNAIIHIVMLQTGLVGEGLIGLVKLLSERFSSIWWLELGSYIMVLLIAATFASWLSYFIFLRRRDNPADSIEAQPYTALVRRLKSGDLPPKVYSGRITAFLNRVDRFMGDDDTSTATGLHHLIGLHHPFPLWTGFTFDRCLQFSILYPIVALYVFWATFGKGGLIQHIVGLEPDPSYLLGMIVFTFNVLVVLLCIANVRRLWNRIDVRYAIVVFLSVLLSLGGYVEETIVGEFLLPMALVSSVLYVLTSSLINHNEYVMTGASAIAGALLLAPLGAITLTLGQRLNMITMSGTTILMLGIGLGIAFGVVCGLTAGGICRFQRHPVIRRHTATFFGLFVGTMIAFCLIMAFYFAHTRAWGWVGPQIFFVGFLALVNAPFDWASLGLTRMLMRRGVQLGKWWPFVLALIDVLLALLLIILLIIVSVIALDIFNLLVGYGGGAPFLQVSDLLSDIATDPGSSKHWWLYATVFSGLIPSFFNLFIGGASIARGIPRMSWSIAAALERKGRLPGWMRARIAFQLTLQWLIGGSMGLMLLALMVGLIIYQIMPALIGLLDLARVIDSLFDAAISQISNAKPV